MKTKRLSALDPSITVENIDCKVGVSFLFNLLSADCTYPLNLKACVFIYVRV